MKIYKIILLFKFVFLTSIYMIINAQAKQSNDFSFIFMTDIHLEYGLGAIEGFNMAIDTVNKLGADFVLTGGDLISDALKANFNRADSLFTLYNETMKNVKIPVYNTIGNHELFGIYKVSGIDSTHPDYNYGMFERYFGKTYYSFDHKGWHFIVLNSISDTKYGKYKGYISADQIDWLKKDLIKIDKKTPVIVSTHIPFITVYGQLTKGALAPNEPGLVVENSQEVLSILFGYNVKLILQGHLHYIEDVYIQNNIHFLIGGAVSARWWTGPNQGMEEGFMHIKVNGEKISWDYIDFGWEPIHQK